jgi:VanZ family protein
MPVLEIGAEHRADWISNIVLYVPVGFFSAHGLLRAWRRVPRWSLFLLATSFSLTLAAAVEFAQIFFPPRTVALNDVFAEAVGSLVGVVLAARYSRSFDAAFAAKPSATRLIDNRWLALYGLCYVALSLFPYDFVLSSTELRGKMESGSSGWLLAETSQGVAIAAIKLALEIVLTIPIGWWLADRAQGRISIRYSAACGALLGVVIELGQFFMLSGISQGISVLTRLTGVALGAALWTRRSRWTPASVADLLRRHIPWLGVLYGFGLLETIHAFSSEWQGPASARQSLDAVRFLPFYYHYYTTELQALVSLCAACLLYAPIGLAVWAEKRGRMVCYWPCGRGVHHHRGL